MNARSFQQDLLPGLRIISSSRDLRPCAITQMIIIPFSPPSPLRSSEHIHAFVGLLFLCFILSLGAVITSNRRR